MSRNRDLGEFPAAALDIDASGNVGIGTSSPAYELDVNGQINIADGMNIRCEGHILIGKNTGDEIRVGSGNTTDILKLYAGGPERMRIDLDGNVGIGVTPSAWNTDTSGRTALQIGFGSISGRLNDIQSEFTNNAYATGTGNTPQYTGITRWGKNQIAMADDGVIVFNNAPTVTEAEFALSADFSWNERMRIDSVGNVGIGTSSPAAELQVSGGTQGIIISQSDAARDLGYYAQIKAPYADKSFELNVNNKKLITAGGYMHATSLMFHTDDIERVRIDGSGNLLVGTTTVPASGNTTGFRVDESGYISLTGAGTSAIDANRMGSDGPVINIRKDGTTSGNIGVSANGTEVYLAGSGGNTSGIFCSNGNALLSMKAGVLANGTQDLGSTSYRFKDLHLAGSIQSSGGATNILGTTTVFSASNFSITTSAQTVVPQSAIPTLPTGVYLMTIYLSGGGWYSGYVSGLVQHYASTTNSSAGGGPNTIHLTAGGHALNSGVLYARYQTTLGNDNQHGVQIWSSVATTVNSITISWKRLS